MHENHDFVVPVNILTPFVRALFSWDARHTTGCLDILVDYATCAKQFQLHMAAQGCMLKLLTMFAYPVKK